MRKRRYGQVRKTKILWPFEKFRGAGRKQLLILNHPTAQRGTNLDNV